MPSISPRSLTLFAVLVGGAGGAVVALRSTPPSSGQVACTSSATAAPAPSSAAAPAGSAPRDAGAPPAPRPVPNAGDAGSIVDALEANLPANEVAVLGTGLLCARGHAVACFQVARAYASGRGVPADFDRARSFRWRGLNLFFKACYDKDPQACYALAHLYRTGDGVLQSSKQADGLIQHTRLLCSFTPSPVCSKLGAAGTASDADGGRQTR
jgi:hypothetical protein